MVRSQQVKLHKENCIKNEVVSLIPHWILFSISENAGCPENGSLSVNIAKSEQYLYGYKSVRAYST